jgi:hypothetical protein
MKGMRRAGHVARVGDMINASKIVADILEGGHHSGDSDVDGRIILKWILKEKRLNMWNRFSWLRIVSSGVLL